MLNVSQFQQWCRACELPAETVDLITRIRFSPPARRVQGRAGNVSGTYPSRKMGVTIQFESQSVELGALYLMDHDESVLEFYDQPHTFKLKYLNKTGKRMQGHFYTPDFLVLRTSGVVFEEWKMEDELLKLAEKQPYRYQRVEDGSWRCPPAEALAQSLGLSFRVCSSALLPRIYIDNLDFLADYFITPPRLPETVVSLIQERVQASPGITIAALVGDSAGLRANDVYALIAASQIFVDLNLSSLRDHYRTRLFPDRNAALAYAQLGPVASHMSGNIAESVHAPISTNTRFLWDGRIWILVNLGETTTTLLPEIGEPIQLPSAFFLHLLETHTVTIPSEGKLVQNAQEIQERMVAASPADLHTANERFRLNETGLTPIGNPTREEWLECGRFLRHAEQKMHFWIGDWLRYGEAHFREDYQQLEEITGYSYHTLRRDKYTASRIEPERRRSTLDVAIHHEVAPLPQNVQEQLLTKAETHGYTVQQVRIEKQRLALETVRPAAPIVPDSGLFLGDCVDVLNGLEDESLDLLLTDPPYGINYRGGNMRALPFGVIENDTSERAPLVLDQALAVGKRKLKTNSHVFVFSIWKSLGWMLDVVGKYFEVKTVLCWVKNYFATGDYFGTFPSQYEMIIHAHKGRRLLEGNVQSNVLHYDHVPNNNLVHPAEKPLPLLEYLICRATHPGETVCDPFMGSASTCLAAKKTNRKYIGVEIDSEWFSLAQQRLTDTLLQTAS